MGVGLTDRAATLGKRTTGEAGTSGATWPSCPTCGYNLTGLPTPRCPECGEAFDWEAVYRATGDEPQIAFERWTGRRRWAGFVVTWLTVLAAPWVFARQAVRRVGLRPAMAFGGVCLAAAIASLATGADVAFLLGWLPTCGVGIVTQALLLTLADWSHWGAWRRSMVFWVAIGGYTSAIVPTEIIAGPPPLLLSDLVRWASTGRLGGPFNAFEMWPHGVQLAIWLLGLGACFAARQRSRGVGVVIAGGAAGLLMLVLLIHYAAIVEYVGWPLCSFLDDRLPL